MQVLILGAKGMLGNALQRAFESEEVIAWDRDDLDITNREEVLRHIQAIEPDVVINAAAYTNVEQAEAEPEIANKVNGEAVGYIAEACAGLNIPVIHYSTDYVFASEKKEGYSEEEVPNGVPINTYGRSKLLGEKKLQEKTGKFWLIRTAWLFGPYGKNFVETMVRMGKEKKELSVVGDQHGSPTYTKDLAQATFKLVHDNPEYGVYHLTNGGNTTWAEFAETIFKLCGMDVVVKPISSVEYSGKAKRPQWSVLKNTKRPLLRDWREAVKDYINVLNVKNP